MNDSKKKRVSWLMGDFFGNKENSSINTPPVVVSVPTVPTMPIDDNHRRISFAPFSQPVQLTTPPQLDDTPNHKKLSIIQEESASHKKHQQISVFKTPKQQQNLDHLHNSIQKLNAIKPKEFEVGRSLTSIGNMLDNQAQQIARLINKDSEAIEQQKLLLISKIEQLQDRLISLNKQELHNNNFSNKKQMNESKQQPNQIVEEISQKGTSQSIRVQVIKMLGYKLTEIQYDKKYYLNFSLDNDTQLHLQLSNNKSIRSGISQMELFHEFTNELHQNQLVMSGLKVVFTDEHPQFPKAQLVEQCLKLQYSNKPFTAFQLMTAILNKLPTLIQQVQQLEQQMQQLQYYGCLWKIDIPNGCIQVLYSYRAMLNDVQISQGILDQGRLLLRFMLFLKDFRVCLYDSHSQVDLIMPFLKNQNHLEMTFGNHGVFYISNELKHLIDQEMQHSNNLVTIIESLNLLQLY